MAIEQNLNIDLSKVAYTEADAAAGNFIPEEQIYVESWNGDLEVEDKGNAYLVSKDGTSIGWVAKDGIQTEVEEVNNDLSSLTDEQLQSRKMAYQQIKDSIEARGNDASEQEKYQEALSELDKIQAEMKTRESGAEVSEEYIDENGNRVTEKYDYNGNKTIYVYDEDNKIISTEQRFKNGGVIRQERDANGKLVIVKNTVGGVTAEELEDYWNQHSQKSANAMQDTPTDVKTDINYGENQDFYNFLQENYPTQLKDVEEYYMEQNKSENLAGDLNKIFSMEYDKYKNQ